MQYQVPQFIDTEDKVVGPFSIRQFAYVGVACLVSAIFYFMVSTWLFVIIAIILIGGSLALSFVKIEGRSLAVVLMSAVNFYWKPQTYIWQAEHPTIKTKAEPAKQAGLSLEDMIAKVAQGTTLHKSWENVQTGALGEKTSSWQFLEKKMNERYQIFRKTSGDRNAARRIDYR